MVVSSVSPSGFDEIPVDVLANSFSRLPLSDQRSLSLVCRRMNKLVYQMQNRQHCKELAEKLGQPVDVVCVDLLRRFKVKVFWLAKREKAGLKEELLSILGKHFEYLTQPSELRKFLANCLLANTIVVAQFLFGTTIFNEPMCNSKEGAKDVLRCFMSEINQKISPFSEQSLEDQIEKNRATVSACEEKVQKIADYLRDEKPKDRLVAIGGNNYVQEGAQYILWRNLQIPPVQLLSQIRPLEQVLDLHNASRVPIGICSLTQIKELRIINSCMKELPDEIVNMKLDKLYLFNCKNLSRLPPLSTMASLKCCEFHGYPNPQDPEILNLRKKGIRVSLLDLGDSDE